MIKQANTHTHTHMCTHTHIQTPKWLINNFILVQNNVTELISDDKCKAVVGVNKAKRKTTGHYSISLPAL